MRRIERILCPTDLSEESQHAIDHALALARWFGASITALHVHGAHVVSGRGVPVVERAIDGHERQELERQVLASFGTPDQPPQKAVRSDVASTKADGGPHAAPKIEVAIALGGPASRIVSCASELGADLIVMGTHGAGGFERLMLGSVTEKVLRAAPCPVLTVPPKARATSTLPFKRILCALDFSDSSLAGAELAFSLAEESGGSLTLAHVVEWPWEEPPAPALEELPAPQAAALSAYRSHVETIARNRLDSFLPQASRVRASTKVVHGKSHAQILCLAAEEGADLIVMGVHGRSAADLMFFGSTTNQVVRSATCPVLTWRR
jgi:nucleotide-binding universal stress UspA family protein